MPWHGHIFLIQSFNIEDDGSQSAPLLLSTQTCALSDLVNGTGGNISYCDNSDGSTVLKATGLMSRTMQRAEIIST
ncbi:hypothetical protein DPMN_160428 [Dreissena polymorpha]|uniref:Uncharacterized protein n=1 Tax=Dreissena polymorpha TaxID=45954 RepID=A0A9D4INR6_DREPO|nr:hypothetical protein DPMN_160428 [Dreissena polymorpha]